MSTVHQLGMDAKERPEVEEPDEHRERESERRTQRACSDLETL